MKKTILLISMVIAFSASKAQTKCDEMITTDSTVLNLKNLYKQLLRDSVQFPEIVLKQAVAETGWLKSSACKKRNNLFGLKNGVASYVTWQDCVKAYKAKIQSRYKGGDYEQFLIKIQYAKDGREYIKFLHKIKIPECVYN